MIGGGWCSTLVVTVCLWDFLLVMIVFFIVFFFIVLEMKNPGKKTNEILEYKSNKKLSSHWRTLKTMNLLVNSLTHTQMMKLISHTLWTKKNENVAT